MILTDLSTLDEGDAIFAFNLTGDWGPCQCPVLHNKSDCAGTSTITLLTTCPVLTLHKLWKINDCPSDNGHSHPQRQRGIKIQLSTLYPSCSGTVTRQDTSLTAVIVLVWVTCQEELSAQLPALTSPLGCLARQCLHYRILCCKSGHKPWIQKYWIPVLRAVAVTLYSIF